MPRKFSTIWRFMVTISSRQMLGGAVAQPQEALHAELDARNGDDLDLFKQAVRQTGGVFVERPKIGETVEGAVRLGALDTFERMEPGHHDVPVVLESEPQAVDTRLDAVDCGDGGVLQQCGWP